MGTIEIITLVISVAALLVAVFSWLEAQKANKNTLHNTKTFFDSHIAASRDKVRNLRLLIVPLVAKTNMTEEEKKSLQLYQSVLSETREEYLNALNQACNAYNAKRLDKNAFELEYKDDIQRVCNSAEFLKLLKNTNNDYSSFRTFIEAHGIKVKDEESV